MTTKIINKADKMRDINVMIPEFRVSSDKGWRGDS